MRQSATHGGTKAAGAGGLEPSEVCGRSDRIVSDFAVTPPSALDDDPVFCVERCGNPCYRGDPLSLAGVP